MAIVVGMLDECHDSLLRNPDDHNNCILGQGGTTQCCYRVSASRNDGLGVCSEGGQPNSLNLYSLEVRVDGGYC